MPDEREIPVASVYDRRGDDRRSQSAATAAKIKEGLKRPRVLTCPAKAPTRRRMLCISANAFDSDRDWSGLKSQTFRFRDPLSKERRFLPLRLDYAPSKAPWRNSVTSTGAQRSASGTAQLRRAFNW